MIRRRELRFPKDRPFKVVQFTDLHLNRPEEDAETQQVMAAVLAAEPDTDLVVLSGDIISGWLWDKKTKGWAEDRWQRVVQPLVAAGVPYAICLGNHDIEADLTANELVTLDQRCSELSLTQHGPLGQMGGTGNYWLSILPSTSTSSSSNAPNGRSAGSGAKAHSSGGEEGCQGEAEAARIWLLDSPRCSWLWSALYGVSANAAQRLWLMREGHYARDRGVPQLAFTHIPPPEFLSLWNSSSHVVRGSRGEPVCCRNYHPGLFEALQEAGVGALYVGHDHANDWSGTLEGVRLAYGRVTGAAGYGSLARGGRVILLREGEDPSQGETYIRLADGSKVVQQPSVRPWWTRMQWFGR